MNYYEQLVEKLSSSQVYLALITNNFLKDSKCATEIGLAVLLDKPIILVVKEGTKLPENLKKVAKKIEYFKGPDDIGLVTKKVIETIKEEEG